MAEETIKQDLEIELDAQKNKFLSFRIGDEEYAIPISFIIEIISMLKITEVPQTPEYIKGVINLRGKVIPIMDVRIRFNMAPREYDERTCIIVVNHDDNAVGLVVDRVSEVLDIQPENIDASPQVSNDPGRGFIEGMGKVNEQIKMIIDLNALLYSCEALHQDSDIEKVS